MDEYKEIVFDLMAPAGEFDLGPLEYMRDLRTRMQCKPFKWLLDNVYPELFVPFNQFKVVAKGEIRNVATSACFDTMGSTNIGTQVGAYPCHGQKGTQAFYFTDRNSLRLPTMDFNSCLDRDQGKARINIWGCQDNNQNQVFKWNSESGQLADSTGRTCVEVRAAALHGPPPRRAGDTRRDAAEPVHAEAGRVLLQGRANLDVWRPDRRQALKRAHALIVSYSRCQIKCKHHLACQQPAQQAAEPSGWPR